MNIYGKRSSRGGSPGSPTSATRLLHRDDSSIDAGAFDTRDEQSYESQLLTDRDTFSRSRWLAACQHAVQKARQFFQMPEVHQVLKATLAFTIAEYIFARATSARRIRLDIPAGCCRDNLFQRIEINWCNDRSSGMPD